jgi:peptidoglycan hydrolase-like protein with peptidoglycan-binding domain
MPSAAPVLALLGIGTAIALAASSSHAKPAQAPAPKGATVTLDTTLPAQLEDQIVHALSTSQDPAELSALADQLDAKGFPLAATALRARAAQLQAQAVVPGAVTPAASTPSTTTPPTGLPGLDPNISTMGPAVLAALSTETDPAKLIGFAHSIQDQYPMAAAALMTKAAALQAAQRAAQAAQAAAQGVLPTTNTSATPAATTAPGTPLSAQPSVVPVPTPAPTLDNVIPHLPKGPGSWVMATDADVARDGVAGRYGALLAQSVGTTVIEPHNGRTWEIRVISNTTDPNLTTFAKDVKGWIWQPSSSAPAPAPVLAPVVTSQTMANVPANPALRQLQHNLNLLGQQPPLAEDGINGPKTIAAVKAFQTAHGLTVDGIAGPQTNRTIAAALAGGAPAPSTAPPAVAPPSAAPAPAVVTVQDVQAALNQLGVPQPLLKVDGVAGALTQAAVKLFQMQQGLTIDGIAGPKTKAALAAALGQLSAQQVSSGRRGHLWRAA